MVSVTTNERSVDFRQAQREWELLTPMFKDILLRTDLRRSTVVDAGTGQGRLAFFLAPHVGRVVAIDVDENALWQARQYAAFKNIRNIDFLLANLEDEPFRNIYDGPVDAVVSSFYMSEAFLWRITAAMPVGSVLVFCCHHSDHWRETGIQSSHAYAEEDLEDLLREDFFEPEFLGVEQHVIQFNSMDEVELFLGGRKLREWMEDGRWDALKDRFQRGEKQLTLSYLVGKARRGPGSHW
jgi:SAM-dependent methyltransferase